MDSGGSSTWRERLTLTSLPGYDPSRWWPPSRGEFCLSRALVSVSLLTRAEARIFNRPGKPKDEGTSIDRSFSLQCSGGIFPLAHLLCCVFSTVGRFTLAMLCVLGSETVIYTVLAVPMALAKHKWMIWSCSPALFGNWRYQFGMRPSIVLRPTMILKLLGYVAEFYLLMKWCFH
jgi:hypothetical protein